MVAIVDVTHIHRLSGKCLVADLEPDTDVVGVIEPGSCVVDVEAIKPEVIRSHGNLRSVRDGPWAELDDAEPLPNTPRE
jgi:hypothetical protein